MKKVILLFYLTFCIMHTAFAQNPLVKMWDKRYGGIGNESLNSFLQTSDGGFILGGCSTSGISGDKTQANIGLGDYWVVKLDSLGNKQWDKNFGSIVWDYFESIKETSDKGYILGGYTDVSGISGDKTDPSKGANDFWIIKIDSLGNKQWDKDFGGTSEDVFSSLEQTYDGGYILAGSSISGIGGDKSQVTQGDYDYWIVKIDSLGIKQWDKDFGGSAIDQLNCVLQTRDHGLVLCGQSFSNISGDKTQDNWDLTGNTFDYWIVRTDSVGNKKWDKRFGGTDLDWFSSLKETSDGGYIIGGTSVSEIGGDKTQSLWGGSGFYDYWIVKTDSLGLIQWDKDIGGNSFEEFFSLCQTSDASYLIAGDSYSDIGGNKTESNLGLEQTWVIKIDSLGNGIWDKTITTPGHDEGGISIQTDDGCYVVANQNYSGIGGYKSQSAWNNSVDYWIIKFCDSTFLIPIATAFADSFLCPGTCTNFTNHSSYASSYQWTFSGASPPTSTDANPTNICYSTSGTYDVQLIASNANGSDTLLLTNYITVYPSPPAQAIVQSGDTLTAIAGSATYQWYFNGSIINGATDYLYKATQSGDYNVVATDSNGCEVEAVINNVAASIQYTVDSKQFTIFPNPVDEELIIKNEELRIGTAATISIYNLIGEKVLAVQLPTANCSRMLSGPTCSIDVSGLPPGMYWLDVSVEGKTLRAKFVKQ